MPGTPGSIECLLCRAETRGSDLFLLLFLLISIETVPSESCQFPRAQQALLLEFVPLVQSPVGKASCGSRTALRPWVGVEVRTV